MAIWRAQRSILIKCPGARDVVSAEAENSEERRTAGCVQLCLSKLCSLSVCQGIRTAGMNEEGNLEGEGVGVPFSGRVLRTHTD